MKMPCRSTITVDAPVCEALSPKRPLGYTSVVSIVVKLPRTFVKVERVCGQSDRVKNGVING
jgi:hypothetical protein